MFRGGFQRSATYSDITLSVNGKLYRAHKIILSFSSDFFASLLSSEFKEKRQDVVELKVHDPKNVFPLILDYIYAGKLDITPDRVIAVLAQAEQYLIRSLVVRCREFVNKHISRSTVLALLTDAMTFHQDHIVEQCLKMVASNFLHMQKTVDFTALDPDAFCKIVHHERLAANDEAQLYKIVCNYIEVNKARVTPEVAQKMLESVRYRWFTYKQLTEAVANPFAPKDAIIEALMARLHGFEAPKMKLKLTPRLQRRLSRGVNFEVSFEDGKPRGIIHWFATNGGQSAWQNPALNDTVIVTASSVERGSLSSVVDEQPQEMWTQSIPASWICVDLIRFRVVPHAYTLRHGGNFKAEILRNWDFQGSNDGSTFTTLRRHYNDEALTGPFDTKTFTVENVDVAYRVFRILQTGHNNSGRNFLALCGLELFGEVWSEEVFADSSPATTPVPPRRDG